MIFNQPEKQNAVSLEMWEAAERILAEFEADPAIRVLVLSEYGITAVSAPVHINRALRRAGLVATRVEVGEEHFDAGASAAFAVADHQVAHVYVQAAEAIPEIMELCRAIGGVDCVLGGEDREAHGLGHPRGGDLILVADRGRWFSYAYWNTDRRAPDFARTVDIHRKPGYDPLELFVDPRLRWPKSWPTPS